MLESSPSLAAGHDSLLVASYLRLRGSGGAVQSPPPSTPVVALAPLPRSGAAIDHGAMLPKWLRRVANLELNAEPLAITGYLHPSVIPH
jgi:hypothetical protein